MVFRGKDATQFSSPHNDPLVVKMKIVGAIVRRILVDTGSSVDIITWDCLKRLSHPGRNLVPMANPVLGFGGQEVNPTGVIRLPVRFGNKSKFKSLEIAFLAVDVPTAYNVIIGRPTLHRVKAVVVPYLIQLQFETGDGNIGEFHGDQRTARECYLVSIKPLIEWTRECGTTLDGEAGKGRVGHSGPRGFGNPHSRFFRAPATTTRSRRCGGTPTTLGRTARAYRVAQTRHHG